MTEGSSRTRAGGRWHAAAATAPPEMKPTKLYLRALDLLFAPLTLPALLFLKLFRKKGVWRMPITKWLCYRVGVFPVRDHYYEPLFHPRHLRRPLGEARSLPGVDLDPGSQREFLNPLGAVRAELLALPFAKGSAGGGGYYFDNTTFGPGDAEVFYGVIRHYKPSRLVEVGCGRSTLVALQALGKNREEDAGYTCEHICIEPYEKDFFRRGEVRHLKERVEDVPLEVFGSLRQDDILFIDSSHMVRPQGDVLFEFLQVLPLLAPGVLVHVHDIFTPRDYPDHWIRDAVRFWNEQYLLEAFLSCNGRFQVVAALNHLKHTAPDALFAACPVLAEHAGRFEPGSIWLRVGG